MNKQASFLCDTSEHTVTVYIRGEVDHHTAVSIRNGIDGMLFEKRPSQLILDLAGVSFMDSSGLGLIMGRLSVMKSLGGDMILRNPGRETDTMLQLSGMERLLQIERTEASNEEKTPVQLRKTHVPHKAAAVKKASTAGGGQRSKRRTGNPKTIA